MQRRTRMSFEREVVTKMLMKRLLLSWSTLLICFPCLSRPKCKFIHVDPVSLMWGRKKVVVSLDRSIRTVCGRNGGTCLGKRKKF